MVSDQLEKTELTIPGEEKPISRFKVFKPREVLAVPPEEIPYQALVKVFGEDESVCFQTLETADADDVGLKDYRRSEIEAIRAYLETQDVVVLIGPSTAGKTEAVLYKDSPYFSGEDTLSEDAKKSIYIYLATYKGLNIEKLRSFINQDCQRNGLSLDDVEIFLIDEFTATEESVEHIKYLLSLGKKMVLAMGGKRSNQLKLERLREVEELSKAPVVEISIKPLNQKQLNEVFSVAINQERQNREKQISKIPDGGDSQLSEEEEQRIKRHWEVISSSGMPIHYFSAKKIAEELASKPSGFEIDSRLEIMTSLEREIGLDEWKEMIERRLTKGKMGEVYSLNWIRRMAG